LKILVAYASAHGTTAEVAEFISNTLEVYGADVTYAAVETVESVEGYDAFVLGSAIHEGIWLRNMMLFIDKFEAELAQKPVYFFITCIRIVEPDGYEHVMKQYMHGPTLEKLKVRNVNAFGGAIVLKEIDWNERWTLGLRYDGTNLQSRLNADYRDWYAIGSWVTSIAKDLALKPAHISS
jgi:menaquinone-dependent protoporphyrinogen oxidase